MLATDDTGSVHVSIRDSSTRLIEHNEASGLERPTARRAGSAISAVLSRRLVRSSG